MDVVRTEAFIDGRWTAAAAVFDVLDPAGGSSIAGVSDCGAGHAADAVAAAARALPAWSKLTAKVTFFSPFFLAFAICCFRLQ